MTSAGDPHNYCNVLSLGITFVNKRDLRKIILSEVLSLENSVFDSKFPVGHIRKIEVVSNNYIGLPVRITQLEEKLMKFKG